MKLSKPSVLPPEALDESASLITSDAVSLAQDMIDLCDIINLKIFGGCCGTDHTHIKEIAGRIKLVCDTGCLLPNRYNPEEV